MAVVSAHKTSAMHPDPSPLTVAVVELVVPRSEGVEADEVHHLRVGEALEQRVEAGTGDGVSRVQLDDAGGGGLDVVDRADQAREASVDDLGLLGGDGELQLGHVEVEVVRQQMRVLVVDVHHRQLEELRRRRDGRSLRRHALPVHELRVGAALLVQEQLRGVLRHCDYDEVERLA